MVLSRLFTKSFDTQDTVNYPVHIKNMNLQQLRQLCKELRSDIIHTVSATGGAKPFIAFASREAAANLEGGCLQGIEGCS